MTSCWLGGGGLSGIEIKKTVEAYAETVPIYHQSLHDYFVIDEMDRLTAGAQQSLRTTMNLKRCMFFCTTNNLSAIDQGVINRCHLIEMNQATNLSAYLPLASTILTSMGVASTAVPTAVLTNHATAARGSMRDFINSVVVTGVQQGGSLRL